MPIQAREAPSPRKMIETILPHRGFITPDGGGRYLKYSVRLGEPSPAGFVPMLEPLRVVNVGVIFLRTEGSVQRGFYAVTPRDIFRRRIDARPCRKLSLEQATLFLGGAPMASSDEPGPVSDVEDSDDVSADSAFEEQVQAILHAEDCKI